MSKRWTHSKKTIYNLGYHITWCPKYRRKVLVGDVEHRLRELLSEKAKQIDVVIKTLEVTPDHIHLFVKTPPTASPHWVVHQLKGYTSRVLRQEQPQLKRMPTLWTRSYYIESLGHVSEDSVKKYVEAQKGQ
jgi:putative transposase